MTGNLEQYFADLAREATERALTARGKAAAPVAGGPKPRWHVIRSNIKCETRAKLGIGALGFPVFLPLDIRTVVRRRRKIDVSSPVFGRYLFVEFDADHDEWSAIRHVDGVEDILTNKLRPVPVPGQIIEGLRLAEKLGSFDRRKEGKGAYAIGSSVSVAEGAFAGFVAKVRKLRTGDRVDILLKLLGAPRVVTVPLSSLREAG